MNEMKKDVIICYQTNLRNRIVHVTVVLMVVITHALVFA